MTGARDAQPLPDATTTARAYDVRRATQARPIVRFQRSGWTGAARCAQIVWGGDPTTDWGFDGLDVGGHARRSAWGCPGVARWGSDIGGFFALGERAARRPSC